MPKINVNSAQETVGNQAYFAGMYLICDLFLKEGIGAAKFASEEVKDRKTGVRIVRVRPALETFCTMTIC